MDDGGPGLHEPDLPPSSCLGDVGTRRLLRIFSGTQGDLLERQKRGAMFARRGKTCSASRICQLRLGLFDISL